MDGFEHGSSGARSECSTNCDTMTEIRFCQVRVWIFIQEILMMRSFLYTKYISRQRQIIGRGVASNFSLKQIIGRVA